MFAFGKLAFRKDDILDIRSLRKEAYQGLHTQGSLKGGIDAVKPLIHCPQLRFKFYCVLAVPLLRILGGQSFFVDHWGESSTGKTAGFDAGYSMLGNPEQLRFNGDIPRLQQKSLQRC